MAAAQGPGGFRSEPIARRAGTGISPAVGGPEERLAAPMPKRDYGLTGESTRWAIETGLASAEWYHSDVPRAR